MIVNFKIFDNIRSGRDVLTEEKILTQSVKIDVPVEIICENDKYGVIDSDKRLLFPCIFDSIEPFHGFTSVAYYRGTKCVINQLGYMTMSLISADVWELYKKDKLENEANRVVKEMEQLVENMNSTNPFK